MKKILTSLYCLSLLVLPLMTACDPLGQQQDGQFRLLSQSEIITGFHEGLLQVKVYCPTGYDEVKVAFPRDEEDWVSWLGVEQGANGNEALVNFKYQENASRTDRETLIAIAAEDCGLPLEVRLIQKYEQRLCCDRETYYVSPYGGQEEIPIDSKVSFDFNMTTPDGENWLEATSDGDSTLTLKFKALEDLTSSRSADITLVQNNAPQGTGPQTCSFSIVQTDKKALVNWAVKMHNTRIGMDWQEDSPLAPSGCAEALICPTFTDEYPKTMTVMGVTKNVLIRFGQPDGTIEDNSVLFLESGRDVIKVPFEFKNKHWYHLALNWDNDQMFTQVFINGKRYAKDFNADGIAVHHDYADGDTPDRPCWWWGYSVDRSRCFEGLMTEFRIYQDILTEIELSRRNHFYYVDNQMIKHAVGIWKMTEGSGPSIANSARDYTESPLFGETFVETGPGNYELQSHLDWQWVCLPN